MGDTKSVSRKKEKTWPCEKRFRTLTDIKTKIAKDSQKFSKKIWECFLPQSVLKFSNFVKTTRVKFLINFMWFVLFSMFLLFFFFYFKYHCFIETCNSNKDYNFYFTASAYLLYFFSPIKALIFFLHNVQFELLNILMLEWRSVEFN